MDKTFILLLLAICCATADATTTSFTIAPSGPPISVWSSVDQLHKCGVNDTPDIPARVFTDAQGLVHMIVGSTSFHLMTGPSVFNQTRSCASTWNSTQSPDESLYAAAQWLNPPHVFPNGTVVVLVHNEYPNNVTWRTQRGCTQPYPYCWQASQGLAISDNWGVSWRLARPPPGHLVAAVPYKVNNTQLASGWAGPSNFFRNPREPGFFYVAVQNRNTVGLQPAGICFMRTRDLTDPASWRAFGGGTSYNVTFASPFTIAPGTESAHICTVANLPPCTPHGVVYSVYLELFVITMDCLSEDGGSTWMAMSTSPDLVTWTLPVEFYSQKDLPPNVAKNVTSMTYSTFIDPSQSEAGNFGVIGQDPPLFWASIGHSPFTDGRRVWATPFHFEK